MLTRKLSRAWFRLVHRKNLVYNACWEDPRLDRAALELGPDDRVATITSAGCNALDYLLAGAGAIHAVDVNPLQNALLELKLVAARRLDHADFFELFGLGRHARWREMYADNLRPELSPESQVVWDRRGAMFDGLDGRRSFYFRGSAGSFAWLINCYINRVAKFRSAIEALLEAETIDAQREIYERHRLRERMWTPLIRFAMRRDVTLSLLGVPREQRMQLDRQHPGGVVGFVQDCVDAVFTRLPIKDNYFWRVYLTGQYTHTCCPEYLKPEHFAQLRDADSRISIHSGAMTQFLEDHVGTFTRFVLLDHMDWLSQAKDQSLADEWQAIFSRAAPGARVIWRSAGTSSDFVDRQSIALWGSDYQLGDVLAYRRDQAAELHARDRVHTYGSFHIADLLA
jgi:S-adenosylmethionine-diacylglycerol 3-amino-3-carboxypropyl transferase